MFFRRNIRNKKRFLMPKFMVYSVCRHQLIEKNSKKRLRDSFHWLIRPEFLSKMTKLLYVHSKILIVSTVKEGLDS